MDLTLEEPIYDAVAEDEEAYFAVNNHLNSVGKCASVVVVDVVEDEEASSAVNNHLNSVG